MRDGSERVLSERAVNIGLLVLALTGLVAGALLADVFNVLVAVVVGYGVLRLGLAMLRNLARPLPGPPDPGILRRVKLEYRCAICGAEARMTVAPDEDPEPPRHCQDDMDLVAPIE
ncbi:MAG: hypothetical protein OXE79_06275 [Acidimicrobiaceae bacterium]|nr:hypothetical protein [Acidimicrobiaceae bacterium]MCY4174859.1 hypothetical protein [Acidimicrobiaceae bacterium]MCY4281009.1 hypothetical protein [Acidimicrobiaceae bacterium]MCY4294860.1 hypothetical protein [Acidimicrobiaceae bacterium]